MTLGVVDSVVNKYAQSIHARVSGINADFVKQYMYSICILISFQDTLNVPKSTKNKHQ